MPRSLLRIELGQIDEKLARLIEIMERETDQSS